MQLPSSVFQDHMTIPSTMGKLVVGKMLGWKIWFIADVTLST